MKKFLAFVMVCVLLVSLAACRNTEENPTNGTTAPIGSETQNNSNETQDTTVDTPSDNTDSSEATGENESVAPSDATTTPEETTEATESTSNTEATNEAKNFQPHFQWENPLSFAAAGRIQSDFLYCLDA